MIKTVAVDTNVLLDYRFKRNPGFKEALRLLKDCLSNKVRIFIPSIIFPELEWVLRSFYKQPKSSIVKFLESLVVLDGVLTEDKFSLQYALNLFRQLNIEFTDAIILTQISRFNPDEFLTFDKTLKKIYQENL